MCFPDLGEQHIGSNHIRKTKLHQKEKKHEPLGSGGIHFASDINYSIKMAVL